jgi:acyl-CoA thioester hydrolase
MARIQIELPANFLFKTDIPVRVSDLNYGNHLGHDSLLTIMQEARVSFYRQLGYVNELSFEGSVGQIMADAAVVYKSESFLGDILEVSLGVADSSKYGFDMIYLVANKRTSGEVARGKTGIVCFDYATRKLAPIPESLRQKLGL